jgi:hypothetical protein
MSPSLSEGSHQSDFQAIPARFISAARKVLYINTLETHFLI